MLVRHEEGDGAEGEADSCDVEDLTPLRRPLMLPKQADELARWLMPPAEPTQNYDYFKTTYENMMMTKSCNGEAIAIDALGLLGRRMQSRREEEVDLAWDGTCG